MTSIKTPEDGESYARLTEDDVEGHRAAVGYADTEDDVEGHRAAVAMAVAGTEDDVEGHRKLRAEDGESIAKPAATEDDVEGHRKLRAEDGESIAKPAATEDDVEGHKTAVGAIEDDPDVEGHNIGYGSPLLARETMRVRERDIQREASRNSLIRDAKLVIKRRKG
jgi:hypothetical protein